ncbi:MAG: UDP-glucose--hexose-1-phosphate uridylyltransferase [Paenibacillaceae bacterium]
MITININIQYEIEMLLTFALENELIEQLDVIPTRNALLDLFQLSEPSILPVTEPLPHTVVPILENILDYAAECGLLEHNNTTYRDLMDARIMGLLMPRASETSKKFWQIAHTDSIRSATDFFYHQSIASNYIRVDRIQKNQYWQTDTDYGLLEITVNLSRPEKTPQEIALLKNAPVSEYPECLLCEENVGYAGRLNHPARQNHRVIPLTIDGQSWFFQYSPYVYYNEHSIVINNQHVPMKIGPSTFRRLIAFVEQFPHYFIGSNADLPIVGGSILNHDHFQAGRHTFPMELALDEQMFSHSSFSGVRASIIKWPLSVIRLRSSNQQQLLAAADHILEAWTGYSDLKLEITAHTNKGNTAIPHNTITPIARYNQQGEYEMDMVLRNNRTDEQRPDGIFHPQQRLHHIKHENIGLIEVMGLAVLPGRLKQELHEIGQILIGATKYAGGIADDPSHPLYKHGLWIDELINHYGTTLTIDRVELILQQEVGHKFMEVLIDAGVYKRDERGTRGFRQFMLHSGFTSVS